MELNQRYSTVSDLLQAAMDKPDIGAGEHARVYRFPADTDAAGMDRFVVRRSHIADNLRSTTALVPPRLLIRRNFGQPLLTDYNGDISVNRYQSGIPLEDIVRDEVNQQPGDQRDVSRASVAALKRVINVAETRGTNPFIPLMDDLFSIMRHNYRTDINSSNILLDDMNKHYNLVDQVAPEDRYLTGCRKSEQFLRSLLLPCDKPLPNTLADIKRGLKTAIRDVAWVDGVNTMYKQRDELLSKLDRMIDEAAQQVQNRYVSTKPSLDQVPVGNGKSYYLARALRLPFGIVNHTHAVKLDDTPHVLLQRLLELEKLSQPQTARV